MSLGTNIGLRALLTSQAALDTIGHNVANANTEGYSRQRLDISNSRPLNLRGLQLGHGVQADVVERTVDELLNARIVRQTSSLARISAQLTEMQSVEALINEPGGDGFGALLDGMFESLSSLSANPEDIVSRTGTVQSAENLVDRFHQVAAEISQLQRDAQNKATAIAEDVNVLGNKIVTLNEEITQVEATTGTMANDLRDQRDLALRDLSQRVNITARENSEGAVLVQIDGQLLVGSRSIAAMEVETDADGVISLMLGTGTRPVSPSGGELAGLIAFSEAFASEVGTDLDRYARSIVLEFNRAHSGGVPLSGGFQQLQGANAVVDLDGDGDRTDGLLRDAGLPFDVSSGALYVHVLSEGGETTTTERIEVDPDRMTVQGFLNAISSVDGLSARLDSFGRVTIDATSGSRFHFGRPVLEQGDVDGTFGGTRASAVGTVDGPFSLPSTGTINISGPSGPFSVTLDPTSFQTAGTPTAKELAELLNGDPGMANNDLRAVVVGDRLGIQTVGGGPAESFQITGGSALAAIGFTPGTYNGTSLGVQVEVTGDYTGPGNDRWTFQPLGDGTIGATDGLEVAVINEAGQVVRTLDVGPDYLPGNPIAVADGISVSFTVGELSASDGDAFAMDVVNDSDTSDVLVAFGLGALFTGTDATTIELRSDIREDPRLLAASATGSVGDSGAVLDMIAIQTKDVDELDGSLGEFYGSIVGNVGFEISSTASSQEIESFLMESLEAQREEVSGVNVDEELVRMIQFEQSYSAAAQYLQVVNSLTEEVLALI